MPQKSPNSPPVALTIAGSDCSAGAGIQADLKAFEAFRVFGLTAATGIVAESPLVVKSWQATPPALMRDQLSCLLEQYPVKAIKTGLLFNTDLIGVIAELLTSHSHVPLIIDPVGAASSGTQFTDSSYTTALEESLFPHATLITPNLSEAQLLSRNTSEDPLFLATELSKTYQTSFLVKGGHTGGEIATDILATPDGHTQAFSLPRLKQPDFHGTGCTLSAAITAQIANGIKLPEAIQSAKQYLHQAIKNGHSWGQLHALNTFQNS